MKTSKQDLALVKAFIQIQILIETLDEIEDYSVGQLKALTKKYNNALLVHSSPVVKSMFLSNPSFQEVLANDTRQKINELNQYFDYEGNV